MGGHSGKLWHYLCRHPEAQSLEPAEEMAFLRNERAVEAQMASFPSSCEGRGLARGTGLLWGLGCFLLHLL